MKRIRDRAKSWMALLSTAALLIVGTSLAVAADDLTKSDAKGWIELIPSEGLAAWRQPRGDWAMGAKFAVDSANADRLQWQPGQEAAINGPQGRTVNLVSQREFADVEVHVEFMIPKHSNSGVYLMGRYEVQIYDSYGVAKDKYPGIECGGIYPRWVGHEIEGHSPRVNASLPPGQWQTFDIVFRAPHFDAAGKKTANAVFVKVVHNGKLVHENVEVTGPTRATLYEDEKAAGPLMLQGDHGPIAYRNVRVRVLP